MEILVATMWEQELRLLFTIAINGILLFSTWRYARRWGGTRELVTTGMDCLLLYHVAQYAIVGLLGCVGLLNAAWIAVGVAVVSLPAWLGKKRTDDAKEMGSDRSAVRGIAVTAACIAFVATFTAAELGHARHLPPMTTDGLTYHLPAAAQWLQTGRIGVYETWFFNPANTYSPLAGSTYFAWWLAPMGTDVLARFAQAPALLLLLLAGVEILRRLGVSPVLAALVAGALAMARPFMSGVIIAKDDLFLAAFFATLVAGCTRPRLVDRFGAVRIGIALGLMLATKYTALLALPMLLLAIDAPVRAGWRWKRYGVAAALVIILAGPWYVRNLLLTGNPLFPVNFLVFEGLFSTERSLALRSVGGVWRVLALTYVSFPPVPLVMLLVAWLAAIALRGKSALRDPAMRLCLFGPVVGLGLFIGISPYGEVRFLLPTFVLMFVATGLALAAVRPLPLAAGVAGVILVAASLTAFNLRVVDVHQVFLVIALLTGLATGGLAVAVCLHAISRQRLVGFGIIAGALMLPVIYVYWDAYTRQLPVAAINAWGITYIPELPVWQHVREELPPGSTVAYAGTHLTYPLMGNRLGNRVVYAPVRAGVQQIADLPRLDQSLPGERIDAAVAAVTAAEADREVWLDNLRRRGATHLAIFTTNERIPTPERAFVAELPGIFRPLVDERQATLYEIDWNAD